jgi:flavin reductase (DIM6/NTAB) family NADH-FMN oxidoreductase RutF/rubredoxin
MIEIEALYRITYGLFVVSSGNTDKGNGFISNTVFQVTAEPPQFVVCCNKNNFTAGLIEKTKAFSVSILEKETPPEIMGRFGFKSGKDFNKMEGMSVIYGQTGVPIVLNSSIAYLECKVVKSVDVGTHMMFIGELIQSVLLDNIKEPLTYLYYRQVKKGTAPKNAPTYIDKSKLEGPVTADKYKKFKCMACGYIYDEKAENISFSELPDSWICPVCGSEKSEFVEV